MSVSSASSLSVRNEGSGGVKSLVGDKDGVIIVDHGSRRQESNLMLSTWKDSVIYLFSFVGSDMDA